MEEMFMYHNKHLWKLEVSTTCNKTEISYFKAEQYHHYLCDECELQVSVCNNRLVHRHPLQSES